MPLWNNPEEYPDSKVHGANMGPIWGQQNPGGPHVGPMKFIIWVYMDKIGFYLPTTKHTYS